MKEQREPVSHRKMGRPPQPQRSVNVCSRVPEYTFDKLQQRAGGSRSLSAYIAKVLILHVNQQNG